MDISEEIKFCLESNYTSPEDDIVRILHIIEEMNNEIIALKQIVAKLQKKRTSQHGS